MDITELRAAAKGNAQAERFLDAVENRWNAEHVEEQMQSVVEKDISLAQLKEQAGESAPLKEFVAGLGTAQPKRSTATEKGRK